MAQFRLENGTHTMLSGLVKQPDYSFSQYEITGSTQTKIYSVAGILPDAIQPSFFTCIGRVQKPGSGPAPNRRADPLGTASLPAIVTDLAGNGIGAIVGSSPRFTPDQVVAVTVNADGTTKVAGGYQVGPLAAGALACDFNGDGKTDLAVANAGDSTVTILFGSASGKLTMGNTYSTGSHNYPTGIAVAEMAFET